VVSSAERLVSDHPVCAFKGGGAAIFFMAQPPLIVFKMKVSSILMIVIGPVVNVGKPRAFSRLFQAAVEIRIDKKVP
jgi:hypothetical protein